MPRNAPYIIKTVATVLLMTTLSSCASYRSDEKIKLNYAERANMLAKVNQWDIKGKVSVSSTQGSYLLRYYWQQSYDAYDISLVAPIGLKKIFIRGSNQEATLSSSDGDSTVIHDPANALIGEVGWQIPLNRITYWVRGIPAPGYDVAWEKYTDSDGYYSFTQTKWRVAFKIKSNNELPSTVLLYNKSESTRVKLLIKDWEVK